MADIFEQEGIAVPAAPPRDLFTEEGIAAPSITQQNIKALNSGIDLTKDTPDIQPIKQAIDDHRNQIEQLAKARFDQETIDNWKKNPITFSEASKYLDIADVTPDFGIIKTAEAFKIKDIGDRIQKGETITPADQQTMDNYINKYIEMNTRNFSVGGGIAYHLAMLPAFMGEFALTGGVGKLAQAATVKAITKGVEVGAVKAITAKTTGVAANVAARTAMMPGLYLPKYAERRLNDSMALTDKGAVLFKESQETPAISALKAFSYSSAEVASEISGAALGKYIINPISGAIKTPLITGVNKLPEGLKIGLFKAYQKIQPNATVSKVFSAGGYNGMLAELGEERVADVLRETLNLSLEKDYTFDQVLDGITPSKDQLLIEAGLVSILGGVHTGASIATNVLKIKGLSNAEAIETVDNLSATEKDAIANNHLRVMPHPITESILPESVSDSQIKKAIENEPPAIDHSESNGEKLYRYWEDSLNPIKLITQKAEALGADISETKNPYIAARMNAGIAGKIAQNLKVATFVTDENGESVITGKGFVPIMEDFDNSIIHIEQNREVRKQDFEDYLIARRTLTDLQERQDVIVSEKDIMASKENMIKLTDKYGESIKWFDTHAQELYEYQGRILYNLVESNNLTQEQYDEIRAKNQNYVSFQRVMDDETFFDAISSKPRYTNAAASKVIKKIKGSEREIKSPLNSIIINTHKIIDIAERNRIARSVVAFADIMPEYIQKVKTPMMKVKVDGQTTYRPSGIEPKGTITVFEKGKKKYYQVSKPLLEAMTQLDPVQLGFIGKIFQVPATVLRAGATLNPEFWIRNVLRDQSTALIQSGARPTPIDMVRGLTAYIGKTDLYNEWQRSGAAMGSYMDISDKKIEQSYNELMNPQGKLMRYLKNPLNLPADISMALESATRIGVFSKSKQQGLSSLAAGFEAREATLDFARGGSVAKTINRITPFFNAGLQATDKLIRTFKQNPKATILLGTATITFPSILLTGYYLYGAPEDERKEYLEIPQWQRDMFWVYKKGDIWYRYPKPFSLGYVFGSVPERFMTWMYEGDKPEGEALWKDLVMGLGGAISPVYDASALLNPLVKVAVESATNYNFFTGRNIYPPYMESLTPEQRYTKYTSETAKAIGKQLDISPAKIDNALRGTIAGSASWVTGAGDFILNQVKKWNNEDIIEKPFSEADMPVLRAFVVRDPIGSGAQSVTNFYKNLKEIEQKINTYKQLDSEEKQQYLETNSNKIQAGEVMKEFGKQINILNKQSNKIYKSKNMNADDKAESIKEIDTQILIIARTANRWFKENVGGNKNGY